jgi:hypothetical protein
LHSTLKTCNYVTFKKLTFFFLVGLKDITLFVKALKTKQRPSRTLLKTWCDLKGKPKVKKGKGDNTRVLFYGYNDHARLCISCFTSLFPYSSRSYAFDSLWRIDGESNSCYKGMDF